MLETVFYGDDASPVPAAHGYAQIKERIAPWRHELGEMNDGWDDSSFPTIDIGWVLVTTLKCWIKSFIVGRNKVISSSGQLVWRRVVVLASIIWSLI